MSDNLKEGVGGLPAEGGKKEGKVKDMGHSQLEALSMDTAGTQTVQGQGTYSFKEGAKNKGGGKINLGSDRPQPAKNEKFRRT